MAETIARCAWGLKWQVVRAWSAIFDGRVAVGFDALDRHPTAQRLKHNEFRSVWRVAIGDATVIAKVYEPPWGWNRMKQALLGPPARREFLAGLYGLQHNLPTVRPIAYGQRPPGAHPALHVLLTQEAPAAQSLSQHWLGCSDSQGPHSRSATDQFIARVAQFLHQLHAGSLVPADLHPENILVHSSNELMLVDLHKAALHLGRNHRMRILNLADLNQWFQRHMSRTDRLRFLQSYLTIAFGKPSRRLMRLYAGEITALTARRARALEKKRDKRIFGDNRYFGVLSLPDHWTAHVLLQTKRPILGSPCSRLQFTKQEWSGALRHLLSSGAIDGATDLRIGSREIPVSVVLEPGDSGRLRDRWQNQHRAINRHRVVPLPLALIERSMTRAAMAVLITEQLQPP